MSTKNNQIDQPEQANEAKGEYGMIIDGKLYILKFTLEALHKFESRIGQSWQMFLMKSTTELFSISSLQALFWASLLKYRPHFSYEAVLSLMEKVEGDGLAEKLLRLQQEVLKAFLSLVLPKESLSEEIGRVETGVNMLIGQLHGTGMKQSETAIKLESDLKNSGN